MYVQTYIYIFLHPLYYLHMHMLLYVPGHFSKLKLQGTASVALPYFFELPLTDETCGCGKVWGYKRLQ